jgi:ketosteroid isomerase-like protein
MSSNTDQIRSLYEAFGRGDIPQFMSHLADDVEWNVFNFRNFGQDAGIETLDARRGKAEVGSFFAALVAAYDDVVVVPGNILAGGNQVAGIVRVTLKSKATGRVFESDTSKIAFMQWRDCDARLCLTWCGFVWWVQLCTCGR